MDHACQCQAPGLCPLFKREMFARERDICAAANVDTLKPGQREDYLAAWYAAALGREMPPPKTGSAISSEEGPGTELKKLLESLGIDAGGGCQCEARMHAMNEWGPAGCRERRSEIVGWLKEERAKRGWGAVLRAAWRSSWRARRGMARSGPLGWLVNEAIRRAEQQGSAGRA